MDFQELQGRLVEYLRQRIRNGEITERGLARVTGVSQPHIHNVLREKRLLSIDTSDRMLGRLHLDLLDLILPEDLADRKRRK